MGYTTVIVLYFDDIKLSLAGCSPAEPASVLLDKTKVMKPTER